jgi:fimbrial chaperone protein
MRLPFYRYLSGLGIICLSLIFISTKSLSQSNPGQSNNFVVFPVQVYLSSTAPSPNSFISIRNTSTETKRFQVKVFSWTQKEKEPLQLIPTEDLVVFPLLVTIEPAQSRDVRLGLVVPATSVEKTYRIMVEELPNAQTQENSKKSTGVSFRFKMSIPIFVQPEQKQSQPALTNLLNNKGKFSFQLTNTGNVHYLAKELQVTGTDTSGKTLFQKSKTGWYVLSGSSQLYDIELPKTDCQKVANVTVNLKTDTTNVSQSLPTPKGVCP